MCEQQVLKKNNDKIDEPTSQQKNSSTRFNRQTAAHVSTEKQQHTPTITGRNDSTKSIYY
jgi:hypothetical protein